MSRKLTVASSKTTTAKDTVYTVPVKNTGLWNLMYIVSTAGTNTPSVFWYDSSTTTEYLVFSGKNLGAGEYIILNQAEVVLQEGDQIRISQTGTSNVTYIFTIELVANQATQFHGA
jgi:hypothetical protein